MIGAEQWLAGQAFRCSGWCALSTPPGTPEAALTGGVSVALRSGSHFEA